MLQGVGAVLDLVDALVRLNAHTVHPVHRMLDCEGSRTSSNCRQQEGGSQSPACATAGFALVRPPGHHVLPGRPMGFGLLNTIAIATWYLRTAHKVQRVLIFGA